MVVMVMTVMTMVGNGKCRCSSRYQHHNKKSQGGLPHAPIDIPQPCRIARQLSV
jgi:hypothetical protein